MGRAFEYRKATKLKRWGNMARVFTKLGKQIAIAAKSGGDPATNPSLRAIIQNAKAENMPKENIERAIKRAVEKDQTDYKEVVYEGYGPYGVAFIIETATDNPTRTVANIRSYFNKYNGSLGTSGSVEFMFDHKCVFKLAAKEGTDIEELELDLIDHGAEELFMDENRIMIYGAFESFGNIQKYLEENGFEIINASFDRIPSGELKVITAEQIVELNKLIEKFQDDDDVQNVFHNMSESGEQINE
ncbi:MAG: YebC/PmpR family DNA-binding transcriptional regulator [Prevotellaceae bacterium]|jgi:YebC/PmpR family DNA-binding regulatory protein|nr:YebC/PmpR family DNA-binding transcriptional regulator [Prevotellaceae bacterium]